VQFSPIPSSSSLLSPNIFLSTWFSDTSAYIILSYILT
jgi:hypothetical protein